MTVSPNQVLIKDFYHMHHNSSPTTKSQVFFIFQKIKLKHILNSLTHFIEVHCLHPYKWLHLHNMPSNQIIVTYIPLDKLKWMQPLIYAVSPFDKCDLMFTYHIKFLENLFRCCLVFPIWPLKGSQHSAFLLLASLFRGIGYCTKMEGYVVKIPIHSAQAFIFTGS